MKLKSTVNIISKAGAVILATVASFLIFPPVISAEENPGVSWRNVFVFVAGTICVIVFSKHKKWIRGHKRGFYILAALIIVIIGYEVLYYTKSSNCYERTRIVVVDQSFKTEELKLAYENLKNNNVPQPFETFLIANQCSSVNIWKMKDLALPYYGMIVLYLLGLILVTLLLLVVGQFATDKL